MFFHKKGLGMLVILIGLYVNTFQSDNLVKGCNFVLGVPIFF